MNVRVWFVPALVAMALIAAGRPRAIVAQQDARNLVVVLSIDKTSFALNEAIQVHVRILNQGTEPILIGNDVFLGGGVSNLEITLKDATGRVSPKMHQISDYFASSVKATASTAFLGSWMLLRPGSSLTTTFPIDGEMLAFLRVPGSYTLSADYYSDGFLNPATYQRRGLTDDDVKSIPFTCWHGKIGTNTIRLKVISGSTRSTNQ